MEETTETMETEYLDVNDSSKLKALFDLDRHTGSTVAIQGSSKMGKTTFLMYLYKCLFTDANQTTADGGYLPILFSQNKHAKIYKDPVMKDVLKCDKFTKDCETLIYKCQKINQELDKKDIKPVNFLFMFDDIIDIKRNAIVDNLVLTLRNSNISSIISVQYIKLFGPAIRANLNNFLFFGFNTYNTIEDVIKIFLAHKFKEMGFNKMADMVNEYMRLTADFHFLFYNPKKNIFKRYKLNL